MTGYFRKQTKHFFIFAINWTQNLNACLIGPRIVNIALGFFFIFANAPLSCVAPFFAGLICQSATPCNFALLCFKGQIVITCTFPFCFFSLASHVRPWFTMEPHRFNFILTCSQTNCITPILIWVFIWIFAWSLGSSFLVLKSKGIITATGFYYSCC